MAQNPYTEVSASGYNSSPPADDGSETEANRVKYATIKTKLSDPIKTLADTIDDNVSTAFGKVINTDDDENNSMTGSLAFGSSELTIASGVITATRSHHTVDTESNLSSDELSTIVASSVTDGCVLILRAADTGRAVVIKHNTDEGSTGNPKIFLQDDLDHSLDDSDKSIVLQLRSSEWHEVSRSSNSQGLVVQEVYASDASTASTSTTFPADDTIPQITEGAEAETLAITPLSTSNILVITAGGLFSHSATNTQRLIALFQDSTADAIAVSNSSSGNTTTPEEIYVHHRMTAGTTSETTFKLRFGPSTGTMHRNTTTGGRMYGGLATTFIHIMEIKV